MALSPGARLASYEIIAPLGVGGMGEVWRARDLKLGRDVAVKILPELFARDPERLARFRREAHLLASLNHPHIGAIYGFEESNGREALILELVEGPTLADRIAQGPLPLDDALRIARQIAEALEAAHEQGIVHRDLKPSNIKLRSDGTVKVLDFGLAKATEPAGSAATDPATSPTFTARGTQIGVIVGTAAYMAPEQAKGNPVDKRADVWAFGAVLFEMVSGRAAFEGDTVTEILAAVLSRSPDWNALPPATPSAVRRLLRRCLEKDPKRRLRDIADAAMDIEEAVDGRSIDQPAGGAASPELIGRRRLVLGLMALSLVAGTGAVMWRLRTPPVANSRVARFVVGLPAGQTFGSLARPAIAISPDGRRLAFGMRWIYVRELDQVAFRTVATPTPADSLFFSPDGQWLGYHSMGQLLKVPVGGGAPQLVASADPTGVSWPDAETIIFAESDKGLFRVAADGGAPELLFAPPPRTLVGWPQVLPGGRFVLYSEAQLGMWDQADAVISALDGSDRRIVLRNAPAARYVETGHLVYAASDRLMAAPFDAEARRVIGDTVPLPEPVNTSSTSGLWQAFWSRTGTLVHVPPIREQAQIAWVDGSGNATPVSAILGQYSDVRLSPDGHRLATHMMDEENDVWIDDLNRGTRTRVTHDRMEDETPVWSPDGRYVAYAASRAGPTRGVFRREANGSGSEELLWKSAEHSHVIDWSGRALIIHLLHPTSGSDLVLFDLDSRQARPLLQSRFNERYGRVSRNGKWIAYTSDETGREEIYVRPFPSLHTRVPISTEGGTQPIWSRNGRELFYRNSRGIMATTMASEAPPSFSLPRLLFADRFERPQPDGHITYDVATDGRFLMIVAPTQGRRAGSMENGIHVALNWFEDLKARAATK
jgi:eukaryotic-like serine/threonine-protein kinase